MPAVFLHSAIAYLINKWNPKFSLPSILVASMIPDLEVPILYYFTNGGIDRLLFHSIIGAATIGTLVSVAIVVFIYPRFISFFFGIEKNYVQKKCVFSGTLLGLCLIGNLSHVLIDATHHEFNPLLYPILNDSVDLLRISGNRLFDTAIVAGILSVIFLVFVVISLKGGKDFWKKMLVG
jgi:membrane-bound metal-dependent hydrolase YbcI (DUF457 family)